MNWTVFAAYAKGIWAAVGPLLGVLVGAYIANRNQRQHWLADCKKEEYRELLTAMTTGLATFIRAKGNVIPAGERDRAVADSWSNVMESIHNKIFIAPQIERLSIFTLWADALGSFKQGNPTGPSMELLGKMLRDLRDAARNDLIAESQGSWFQNFLSSPHNKRVSK